MACTQEYLTAYGHTGVGDTDLLSEKDEPFVLQAGTQVSIPLASTQGFGDHLGTEAYTDDRLVCGNGLV